MTGLLIVAATALLLALALEPAHRRARHLGSSSTASTSDRDRQRLVADLRQLSPRVPAPREGRQHRGHQVPAV